jgi:hypothetical protein
VSSGSLSLAVCGVPIALVGLRMGPESHEEFEEVIKDMIKHT